MSFRPAVRHLDASNQVLRMGRSGALRTGLSIFTLLFTVKAMAQAPIGETRLLTRVEDSVKWSEQAVPDQQVIYGIKAGGLFYSKFLGTRDGSPSWGVTNSKIGNDWNFRHVFSGGGGVIFAITANGDLLYYRYLGVSDSAFSQGGEVKWGKTGVKIGNGWNFRHVFSGGGGVIFAIDEQADLHYYKYLGLEDGSWSWSPASGAKIGNGWNFRHVFSGGGGVIFAVDEQADLHYYNYLGLEDGSKSWAAASGAKIGNGWDFRHVFSGGGGLIFAVNEQADLLYYRYLGMSTGSKSWAAASGAKIGNGWDVAQVFAEMPSQLPDGSPRGDRLPQVNERCAAYAQRAWDQVQLALRHPGCAPGDSARWNPAYQAHYDACLSAPEAGLRFEERTRDAHLERCGAQARFDAGTDLVPVQD